ncbi:hypothetical protein AB2B41_04445 [Marimonas sp. MJW-29]|uniref:DUF1127 domain-containing protein n=1 Tax=Sulfitobacter sediminis TaxID=3234186 RepID=A0ABV3RIX6_9RHOB
MSTFEANTVSTLSTPRRVSLWKWCLAELVTWNAAWVEKQNMMRLDSAALGDMGIDLEARNKVAVSEIAARIREQRG